MIGITSFGAYVPRLRLSRNSIVQLMSWRQPGLAGLGQGEKAMCNWDEDSLTMAVAAARDALVGFDKAKIDGHYLASTTMPYSDRLNAGIVACALNLGEDIFAADFTSTQKAGTGALLAAFDAIKAGDKKSILVTASDMRLTRPASSFEMLYGDGAASLVLGSEEVIAEFIGAYSLSCDFVDHYRGAHRQFDYTWEERWVRDEGLTKIIPRAVSGLVGKLDLSIDKIDKVAFACAGKGDHQAVAKAIGATPPQVLDNMFDVCGETGCAHPLVLLIAALEQAKPGERILVASFGQGSDALLFQVTENIANMPKRVGVSGSLANRKATDNYMKYLVFRDLLPTETGIRGESPTQTAMSALWRQRKAILGLVGGRCRQCATPQFPQFPTCVNPKCGAVRQFDDYEFADKVGVTKSYSADNLAAAVDPPTIYGIVEFEGGGRFLFNYTDCELSEISVGKPVRMTFRRRLLDRERGFSGYFWKAVPHGASAEN